MKNQNFIDKTKIIISSGNVQITHMWIPGINNLDTVIEQGKRDLLEEELLAMKENKAMAITTCWSCGSILIEEEQCNCKEL